MAWTAPRTWVTGEVVTAALLNTHLRDNLMALRRIDRVQITANVTTTASHQSAATSQTVIGPSTSISYDGSTQIVVKFYAPNVQYGAAGSPFFGFWEDSTQIERQASVGGLGGPFYMQSAPRTPGVGSHTYTVKQWWNTNGQITTYAGVGGGDVLPPAELAVWASGV